MIQYQVELLQQEGSPKVLKTVEVIAFSPSIMKGMLVQLPQVMIDRRCLFAYDVMNGLIVQSPQQRGLVCPCCKTTQEEWDLDHNIGLEPNIDGKLECGWAKV